VYGKPQISSRQIERENQALIKGAYYKFLLNINIIHIVPSSRFTRYGF